MSSVHSLIECSLGVLNATEAVLNTLHARCFLVLRLQSFSKLTIPQYRIMQCQSATALVRATGSEVESRWNHWLAQPFFSHASEE